MSANLDSLRREIVTHLEEHGFAVYKSYPRSTELGSSAVYWDTENHPDYKQFVAVASAAGVRLVTLWSRLFSEDLVDAALERLSEANLSREERRSMERKLAEFRAYEGFLCQIELSFSHDGRTYIFDQPTDWYEEMEMLLDELDDTLEESADENPLGGFYSNN